MRRRIARLAAALFSGAATRTLWSHDFWPHELGVPIEERFWGVELLLEPRDLWWGVYVDHHRRRHGVPGKWDLYLALVPCLVLHVHVDFIELPF